MGVERWCWRVVLARGSRGLHTRSMVSRCAAARHSLLFREWISIVWSALGALVLPERGFTYQFPVTTVLTPWLVQARRGRWTPLWKAVR